jgi:hypothetical protein
VGGTGVSVGGGGVWGAQAEISMAIRKTKEILAGFMA